jgi:hypothetical protein
MVLVISPEDDWEVGRRRKVSCGCMEGGYGALKWMVGGFYRLQDN